MIAAGVNGRKKLDVETVRQAAAGRWVDILQAVGGIPLELLDASCEHPCPRCAGDTRFRLIDEAAGAVRCSHCFAEKCGDGFAAIAWARGVSFPEAVKLVAECCGVAASAASRRNGKVASKTDAKVTSKTAADPAKDLEWQPWSSAQVPWLQMNKPGITEAALLANGCRQAMYKKNYRVFALPVMGSDLDVDKPCGWVIFNFDGSPLQVWKKSGEVVRTEKVKLTYGSKAGIVGTHAVERLRTKGLVDLCWKAEGVSDMLATFDKIPEHLRDRHVVLTNANGAREKPRWMATLLANVNTNVVHDADKPGQAGADDWARQIASQTSEGIQIRNVPLPYDVEETKGKDLRDFFNEGHNYAELLAIAENSEPFVTSKCDVDALTDVISNGKEVEVDTPEGSKTTIEPLLMPDILDSVIAITDGFPKQVGGSLFTKRRDGICWLARSAALFGWLATYRQVKWLDNKTGFVTKPEFFAELQRSAEPFEAIETLPHEPRLPKTYYTCPDVAPGDGKALAGLVKFFRPDTTVDHELIKAFFVTPGWGGRPGSRPAFVVTSDAGRGVGKTKLAEAVSHLWGGFVDVSAHEDMEVLKSRLLSTEALDRRIGLLDNLKVGSLSWANLEKLITTPTISGKRLYHGEAVRPNTLTWILTLNGLSLSTDLAQRCVIIKLARGDNEASWFENLISYIDAKRHEIIADCIAFLRSPPRAELTHYSRWASWDQGVLSRLENPTEAQQLIAERQSACDADDDDMDLVEDFFRKQLERLGYDPDRQSIRIPVAIVHRWYAWGTGEKVKVASATRRLKQASDEGQLHRLQPDRSRTYGRCFKWEGENCDVNEPTKNDLTARIHEASQTKDGKDAW